ncbi:MAG: DUF6502 family protein [Octadecabacter sp.]
MRWLDPILHPLAVLAIRKGWLFPALADRLRHAYLAAAQSEAGPDATDSRLSVMSGLQRRDIARLRDNPDAVPKPQRQPLTEIIARWWEDPAYDPMRLPVQDTGVGTDASFARLAKSVRKDVHPRTFLDMLIAAQAVQEADGYLCLLTKSYVPQAGSDDALAYLGDGVGDHLATAVDNVTLGKDGFDLSVHYEGLSVDAIAQLDALWRKRIAETLHEMNETARAFPQTQNGTHRFRAGAYFHDKDTAQ